MRKLPDVSITVVDGGLGLTSPGAVGAHAKVGVCSQGPVNQVLTLSDPSEITAKLGVGPLADALADSFLAGSGIIYAVRAQGDVAGAVGVVESTKTGTGNMTAAGSPLNAFDVSVRIEDPGARGTATFRLSLDGDRTWGAKQTVPATGTYEIPGTGITLTFTDDSVNPPNSFLAGDTYRFSTTAPEASAASVGAAVDALLAANLEYEFVHVVGESDAALWSALDAKAQDAAAAYRYLHFVAEARGPQPAETVDQWVQALAQSAASFASPRVSVVAGRLRIADPLTGRLPDRNGAGIYCGRLSAVPVMRSPGRVRDGSLPGVVALVPEGIGEGHIGDLDGARFVTFRQYVGLAGFYVTGARMMAAETSDFQYAELRRVMDKACREVRKEALLYEQAEATNEGLSALEAQLKRPLERMAGAGEIRAGEVVIPRNQDIVGTSTLRVRVRLQPVGVLRWIEVEIGFQNPVQAS